METRVVLELNGLPPEWERIFLRRGRSSGHITLIRTWRVL
ncbi:hypothetical protein CDAR_620541, partial [Caerostris darwini]